MKIVKLLVIFSSLILSSSWVNAQGNSSYQERTVYYSTIINGKDNPEGIPYSTKWNLLYVSYSKIQDDLHLILPSSDVLKLAAFVQSEANRRAALEASSARKYEQMCSKVDEYSADEILAELSKMERQYDQVITASFTGLENSLSSEGRAAINVYIETEITPYANVAIIDTIAADAEFPVQFLSRYKGNCTVDREELKRKFDEFMATQPGLAPESSESSTLGSIAE